MAAAAFASGAGQFGVVAPLAGWPLAAGALGAVAGLVAFGAAAGAGHPFATAGLVTFLPAVPVMVLVWRLPETREREPEDLWPGRWAGPPASLARAGPAGRG